MQNINSRYAERPFTSSRGAVLVIGLIILAVMTIIGVTALSGGAIQLRMVSNSQQNAAVFGAAQSAVSVMLNLANTGSDFAVAGHPIRESQTRNGNGNRTVLTHDRSVIHCLNMDRAQLSTPITHTGANAGICTVASDFVVDDNDDTVADSPLRARTRLFYRGKGGVCPDFSGNLGGSFACYYFQTEGVGWLDDDNDGIPDPDDGESAVTVDAFSGMPGANSGI